MSTLLAPAAGGPARCAYAVGVLVVNRFRVSEADAPAFRADVETALTVLAERPGYVSGVIGRNVDDPTLWVLTTIWEHVGAYRRSLSAYDVKLGVVPLLSRALEEPSAFEVVEPETVLNIESSRSLG